MNNVNNNASNISIVNANNNSNVVWFDNSNNNQGVNLPAQILENTQFTKKIKKVVDQQIKDSNIKQELKEIELLIQNNND